MKRIFGLMMPVALMMAAVGCGARNVTLRMPQTHPDMEGTGKLSIYLSASMNAVSVSIDENLVIKEKNTKSITVDGIRAGKIRVNVFGMDSDFRGDLDKTETLEIEPGKVTVMRVQAPPRSIKFYASPVVVLIGTIWAIRSMIPAGTT